MSVHSHPVAGIGYFETPYSFPHARLTIWSSYVVPFSLRQAETTGHLHPFLPMADGWKSGNLGEEDREEPTLTR